MGLYNNVSLLKSPIFPGDHIRRGGAGQAVCGRGPSSKQSRKVVISTHQANYRNARMAREISRRLEPATCRPPKPISMGGAKRPKAKPGIASIYRRK